MVRALVRARRRIDEIAAELADILKAGALPAHDVVPELARGKLVPDHHRAAADQQRAGRDHAAGGVIERQTIVHAVAGARIHDAGEGVAREHHAGNGSCWPLSAGRWCPTCRCKARRPRWSGQDDRTPGVGRRKGRRSRDRCARNWHRHCRAARSARRRRCARARSPAIRTIPRRR